jgi:hypothetical protein
MNQIYISIILKKIPKRLNDFIKNNNVSYRLIFFSLKFFFNSVVVFVEILIYIHWKRMVFMMDQLLA